MPETYRFCPAGKEQTDGRTDGRTDKRLTAWLNAPYTFGGRA